MTDIALYHYYANEHPDQVQAQTHIKPMSPGKPTRSQADQLVAARKVIASLVVWRSESSHSWRLEARALSVDPRAIFALRGYIGRANHSFALLYENYPIRKYTKHLKHRIGDRILRVPHKHVWDYDSEDHDAYIPSDIDPDSDINDQFLAFCSECNIDLIGGYQRVLCEV